MTYGSTWLARLYGLAAAVVLAAVLVPGSAHAALPAQVPAGSLVRPVFKDCPPNTMNYPNPQYPNAPAIYACQFVINDDGNVGTPVGIRLGRPGPLGSGAFGAIHYSVDHNLSDDAVATVIANNGAPITRGDGRQVYGLRGLVLPQRQEVIRIEVVVDPQLSVDGYRFGVVTAYCVGPTICPEGIDEAMEPLYVG